jgi:carbonic anhydrase/acetyltransferase-like protein (isoleucine patch superfamily)
MKNKSRKSSCLLNDLKDLYEMQADCFVKDWKRLLPLPEMVVDRWAKARKLGFGKDVSIYDSSIVFGDVKVRHHTWIGPYTILDGSGGTVKIGRYCSISAGVQIYTHDSVKWALTGGKVKYEKGPVEIGDCCYVGPNSVISRGVTIGDHSIIGAFSFVNKDIPSHSFAYGQPARVVGKLKLQTENDFAIEPV